MENLFKIVKLSDYLNASSYELNNNCSSIIYIDDIDLLKNNSSIFKCIIYDYNILNIVCDDYETILFIHDLLPRDFSGKIYLRDDYKNTNRDYIKLSEFDDVDLVLPFTYLLWYLEIQKECAISTANLLNYQCKEETGFKKITKQELEQLKQIILTFSSEIRNYSDLDKIILVSNYLQRNCQYVPLRGILKRKDSTLILDTGDKTIGYEIANPLNLLLNNYGVCSAFSEATTLLLNNPITNINARNIVGSGHAWTMVNLDDTSFFIDNTWNVTANKEKYEGTLKSKTFNSEFLLFGTKKASLLSHHEIESCLLPNFSETNFPRGTIEEHVKILSKKYPFTDYPGPIFKIKR